jgi:hypothetical protein
LNKLPIKVGIKLNPMNRIAKTVEGAKIILLNTDTRIYPAVFSFSFWFLIRHCGNQNRQIEFVSYGSEIAQKVVSITPPI